MLIKTTYRTNNPEIMDDFNMEGEILQDALDKIAKINQFLGGNRLTLQGVKELLVNNSDKSPITIVDIGCGNGDMLRKLAEYGEKNNLTFQLIGVDANSFTINYARKLSIHYPNISYKCEDIFEKHFEELKYDIVLCTLTLHHFKDDEIVSLISLFCKNSSFWVVINDLDRSWLELFLTIKPILKLMKMKFWE